jgi:hypothetical protein
VGQVPDLPILAFAPGRTGTCPTEIKELASVR